MIGTLDIHNDIVEYVLIKNKKNYRNRALGGIGDGSGHQEHGWVMDTYTYYY